MAAMGIPVVIVPNGAPVSPGALGTPVTIVGGGAVVTDGQSIALTGPDGTPSYGNVETQVSGGSVQGIALPAGSTVITNQAAAVPVQDADGTRVDCTAVLASNGALSYVSVPGTAALAENGGATKVANQNGSGPLDALFAITGGFITSVNLAHPTDVLVSSGFAVDMGAVTVSAAGDDYATINIAAGAITNIGIALIPTKAVATNGQELTIPVTGTYTTKATLTISGGAITAITLS